MSLSRKAGDISPLFVISLNSFLFLTGNNRSVISSFGFLYVLLLNFMTGTAELRSLQYGEEDDISKLIIATSNRKVIPDTKTRKIDNQMQ